MGEISLNIQTKRELFGDIVVKSFKSGDIKKRSRSNVVKYHVFTDILTYDLLSQVI